MPAAIAVSVREEIVRRRQGRETFRQIADDLQVSYNATRRIWAQFQREGQVKPHYERCRPPARRKAERLYEQAVALRRLHPSWGAGLIRLELSEQFPAPSLPSERTMQRWFRRAGMGRSRPDTHPHPRVKRGQQPHEVWAMDAKERMRLADGSPASWLTITDEASGAVLSVTLFPPRSLEPSRPAASQAGATDDAAAVGAAGDDPHG